MDFYLLKKSISLFLHLVPGCLILILMALLLRHAGLLRRFTTPVILFSTVILFLASTPYFSNKLINSLEDQFPVMQAPPSDTTLFLTLGNYASDDSNHPPNIRLHAVSLSRVTETIRLWKQQQTAILLLGGPSRFAMRDFAVENGVAPDNIIVDHTVRDTIDEISAAIKISKSSTTTGRVIVVSSATHLPRARLIVDNAVALRIATGKIDTHNYAYAPADFIAAPSQRLLSASSSYLHKTDRVVHEYIGMLWVKIKLLSAVVSPE